MRVRLVALATLVVSLASAPAMPLLAADEVEEAPAAVGSADRGSLEALCQENAPDADELAVCLEVVRTYLAPETLTDPADIVASDDGRWATGRELMDRLSAEWGYEWYDDNGSRSFFQNGSDPAEVVASGAVIWIEQPVHKPATVTLISAGDWSRHVERVLEVVSPGSLGWVLDATERAASRGGPTFEESVDVPGGMLTLTAAPDVGQFQLYIEAG